jgi:hypothetical protein
VEDVFGLDGDYVDRKQLLVHASQFRAVDLSGSFRLDRQFDLAVSTGVPGLLIALWAAVAALGAVAAVLMHAFVDFDLQIPAIPVLLVCLVGLRYEAASRSAA